MPECPFIPSPCIQRRQRVGEMEQRIGLFTHRTKFELFGKTERIKIGKVGWCRKYTDFYTRK